MLSEAKDWALAVSTISITGGIIASLLPRNTYKKLFKYIVGVVMVYTLLHPIIGKNSINFNIQDYLKDNYQVSENVDKYAETAMLSSAEKSIVGMFSDFAERNETELKINCKCIIENEKILIEAINIIDCKPIENLSLIKDFAEDSGIDKDILIFG